ncbi:hypothetical protein AJ79_00579 [Helicocarpus griseus UAMH5409]|uniref:F-box domain-containing protein n=1 Tax=Helicocarpus griseus UAMH5409 TaxID=1447875 RepID=A0A2B7YAM4_9EURO|nr:hypothetical protein AJ79_00579 [Helicocarpus griseus UAMH5409]
MSTELSKNKDIAPAITKLSKDVMLEIASYLNPRNKLCFGLTCKSLYKLFDTEKLAERYWSLKNKINLDGRMYRIHYMLDIWTLLKQLEDSRYRCCWGCHRLHPVEEFSSEELTKRPLGRRCIFGSRIGLVHLCRCSRITFRDKLKLIDTLKSEDVPECAKWPKKEAPRVWWHECSHNCTSERVEVKVCPRLAPDGGLAIEIMYNVSGRDVFANPTVLRHALCPHLKISNYVNAFLQVGKTDLFEGIHCRKCTTWVYPHEWHFDGATDNSFSIRTQRFLGKEGDEADSVWFGHTDLGNYPDLTKEIELNFSWVDRVI